MKAFLTNHFPVAMVTAQLIIGCTAYADCRHWLQRWYPQDVRDDSWKKNIRDCVDVVVAADPAKTRQARMA